jgi:hypothetical protein
MYQVNYVCCCNFLDGETSQTAVSVVGVSDVKGWHSCLVYQNCKVILVLEKKRSIKKIRTY